MSPSGQKRKLKLRHCLPIRSIDKARLSNVSLLSQLSKEIAMPILSSKRQVTLPKELCDRLRIEPGADLDILEHHGRITILKRVKGRSAGILKHLRVDTRVTDQDSLYEAIVERRPRHLKGRAVG